MTQLQLMEENLARLLAETQSLPEICQEQPANPFQKALFGKKMHRSKAYLPAPTPQPEPERLSLPSREQKLPPKVFQDPYCAEIKGIFASLREQLEQIEENYTNEAVGLRKKLPAEEFQEVMEKIVGELEGSAEFIVNDCLKIKFTYPAHRNREQREQNKENNVRVQNCTKVRGKSDVGRSRPSQMSIYESVLQEREQRRHRKRMV